ncbi:sensor histidine kinase [Empedobacter brevis]|uniref:sensor histidine kinase n=1 Tax=Empedobacter brevis TaxID=247 RepID=UPI002FE19784
MMNINMSISFKNCITIGLHALAWVLLGFLQLFYIPLSWDMPVPFSFWFWQILLLLMMLLIFYVNALVIVPNTIIKHRVLWFLLWILVCIVVTQLVAYTYDAQTNMREQMAGLLRKKLRRNEWYNNLTFTGILLVLAFSTCWAMLMHWQQATQREKALEQDKILSELTMLKMQINPHFFFNSLNSVYALTYIDVEDSRKALLTLGRMMRYLLYKTEEEETTLSKEIDFLKDYVSIMSMRATKKVSIDLQLPDKLEDFPIAPMLLLPFIENAFKHGVDATQPGVVKIHLTQQGTHITLEVVNTVFPAIGNDTPDDEGGVGLSNTQRRLQLLYPERHFLQTGVNDEGKYHVIVMIDLM